MELNQYPRRILLCVTGLSPQIITETLYALAVTRQPAWLPSAIHLLTTAEGAERARLTLLEPESGYFYRLCEDHGLDPSAIHFGPDTIHCISDPQGAPLPDIRTPADNEAAADAITDTVRRLTADSGSTVHASIAGGRKTMGFYLGYALSLFGRPQDRLSHVLVSAPFESHPEFFFPPRKPRVLFTRDDRPVRTDAAVITLADIPLVRLRDGLPEHLLEGAASFSDTVRQAQSTLEPPALALDPASRQIRCGAAVLNLRPAEFAFLAWFARRALQGKPGVCRSAISAPETADYLAEYRALHDALSGEYERVQEAVGTAMDEDYFDSRRSRLHERLRKVLGKAAARPYYIHSDNRRPRSCYALCLEPRQIRFAALTTQGEMQ